MKQYECKVIFLDRIELGEENSQALAALNVLGEQGWHVIHIREDVRNGRSLAFFLERERPRIAAAEPLSDEIASTGSAKREALRQAQRDGGTRFTINRK